MAHCTRTPGTPPAEFVFPHYHLTEDQHDKLYQAYHLIETLYDTSGHQQEFLEVRRESFCVTLRLALDLIEQSGMPFVWRPHHA